MKLVNGKTYFDKQIKGSKAYPYLNKNMEADVLIIGGGITAAITAYYLAKENLKVIVAEKNIIGYGSTKGTIALLDYQSDMNMRTLEKLIGEKRAEAIYKKSLIAINHIEQMCKEIKSDVEFKRVDSVLYTDNKKGARRLEEEYEERINKGYNATIGDKIDTNKMKKYIRTRNGSAIVNPYGFTIELFKYLSKMKGVYIYENTRIDDIYNEKDKVVSITNNDYKITTKNVILATGYDAMQQIKDKNTDLYATYTIVTNKLKGIDRLDLNFTAVDNKKPYHYLRFTRDGRIIFGGEDILLRNNKIDSEKMKEKAEKKYLKLLNELRQMYYMLDDIKMEYAYCGVYAETKDTLPIIDKVKNLENVYCNLSYGGNGILYAAIGAMYLTNIITKNETDIELEMFELNRDIKNK